MTPRGRANVLYYSGIPLCFAGGLVLAIERGNPSTLLFVIGAMLLSGVVALALVGIATSQCPQCRRRIDLRGPSAYCPRCGHWIV